MTTAQMMNIGEFAGKVWNSLNDNGNKPVTLTALAKNTELKKEEAALGIGWLAKEGQISFDEKGKISLNK